MHVYFNIFGVPVAGYGLMIVIGMLMAAGIAVILVKFRGRSRGQELIDIPILAAYIILGGFLGAKLLYILVSFRTIEWSRLFEISYLETFLGSGFVFYGGLLGGFGAFFLAGKLHGIHTSAYLEDYIFLVPFVHSFGRIGCFLAGCCYGIPYSGFGAVVFPEGSYAPAGISLFPVQLVEAAACMLIAAGIAFLRFRKEIYITLPIYLFLYGIVRFLLEFLRYDSERGSILFLSTSQWISLFLVGTAVVLFVRSSRIMSKKVSKSVGKV